MRSLGGKAESWLRLWTRRLQLISLGAILFLILLTTVDVIGRKFFNKPILGGLEIAEMTLVIAVWLAMAYTAAVDRHVRVDFVILRLSPRVRAWLLASGYLLGFVVSSLLTWQSTRVALRAWREGATTDVLHIPMFPARFGVPFGALVLALVLLTCFLVTLFPPKEEK